MSPLPPDPYRILGVSKDAQIPEIRSAHRKLVLKCHPDKVQDPTLKAQKQDEFQKVQQAYELLSNDSERQRYDDKVKLEELRKQFQTKANMSSPRSSPRYSGQDEARGTESRASPFKASTTPSGAKHTYTRSSDEDLSRGARIFDAAPRSSRREASYADKPSKRDMERERERDAREREKDREKERERERRRRQEDTLRRIEKDAKDAKDARRADKRAREKQRDKDMKREAEEKKRYARPYIEPYEDEVPMTKSDKKKPSSKKHEEKRDRSSGREDTPTAPPMPPPAPQRSYTSKVDYATSYIQASRAKSSGPPGLQRSATYHVRTVQPPAPTPPPISGQSAPFAAPEDDDARRSSAKPSAKPRRGSGDDPKLPRERSYRTCSREALEDPPVVNGSPSARHTTQFPKTTATAAPTVPSSPPRTDLPRTKTMPPEPASYARPPAGLSRSQTFNVFGDSDPRGRGRSRMQPQMDPESDSEEVYERRRDRKHRSSRRHHSPEQLRTENVSRYQVDGARSRLHSSYVRHIDPDMVESYPYYAHSPDARPSMPVRETSYSATAATAKFPKVKTSKAYGYEDVQYSYYDKPSREEYTYA